jgi:hypothetical protein
MKLVELKEYNFNDYSSIDIDFYRYKLLNDIDAFFTMSDDLNKYFKLNSDAIKFFSLGNEISQNIKHQDLTNITLIGFSFNSRKFMYLDYILNKIGKSETTLLVSNVYQIINQVDNFKKPFDMLLFKNEDYNLSDSEYDEEIKSMIEKNKQTEYLKSFSCNFRDDYGNNLSNKKYDNIFISSNSFADNYFISFYYYTKIPILVEMLGNSLLRLKENGDLFILLKIFKPNTAFEKIISLLSNSFKDVKIINLDIDSDPFDSNIVIHCKNYLNNLNETEINSFINLGKNNNKYVYNLCQIINYFIKISKDNTNNIMYKFDTKLLKNEVVNVQSFNSVVLKPLMIVDDFNIETANNLFEKKTGTISLLYQLNNIYENYFNRINIILYRYFRYDNSKESKKLKINNAYLSSINYQKMKIVISIFLKNNLYFNQTYIAYIDKYNTNLINKIFSFENILKILLINPYKNSLKKYPVKSIKSFKKSIQLKPNKSKNNKNTALGKITIIDSYNYEQLSDYQSIYDLAVKINNKLLLNFGNKVPKLVKDITDNYSRGVSRFINNGKKYKLKYPISNGFTKMWEILASVKNIIPNRKDYKPSVFCIAEAPGQWIYAIDYFIQKRSNNQSWNWRATSLNPTHPINIQKFGPDILDDAYGFIKKYPEKWLWGIDETGDITNSENIKWYRQYVSEWAVPDLVTGDAGIQSSNPAIYQKLELSQVIMVAAVSQKGSNCIIKHFLPYIPDIKETEKANGFFVNYMFLYYLMFEDVYMIKPLSSNPVSGEFYVVGKNFIGIDDDMFNSLLKLIDNFQVNMCFFKKDDISSSFVKQIFNFFGNLINLNVDFLDIQNTLLTCLTTRDEKIEKVTDCRKYLNPKYMEELNKSKFEKWIETYDFV